MAYANQISFYSVGELIEILPYVHDMSEVIVVDAESRERYAIAEIAFDRARFAIEIAPHGNRGYGLRRNELFAGRIRDSIKYLSSDAEVAILDSKSRQKYEVVWVDWTGDAARPSILAFGVR